MEIRVYEEAFQQQITELILSIQQQEYNIQITKADQPDLMEIPSFYQRGKGVREIYLGTTPEFKAAQRFYAKNGFQSILKEQLPAAFPIVHVDRHFYTYRLAE